MIWDGSRGYGSSGDRDKLKENDMIIEEVENKPGDFTVSDVTPEEKQHLFKKGISALVNEARKGKTQFIVLDPDHPAAPKEDDDPKLTVEIDDDDVQALIQVGITQILIDFIDREKEEEGYWKNLEQACKDAGEEWDEERMDIIGQNGNSGEHYVTDDDGTTREVQHIMKESK